MKIAVIKHAQNSQQQRSYFSAHGYNSDEDKVVIGDENKENENVKLDLETLKEPGDSVNEFKNQLSESDLSDEANLLSFEKKAEQIKSSIKKFNQEYQRCKSKFFGKFKANFSAAVESLDMKKVRKYLNAVYDWNRKTKVERGKELENENYNEGDFMALVNLDNENAKFKKYFIGQNKR